MLGMIEELNRTEMNKFSVLSKWYRIDESETHWFKITKIYSNQFSRFYTYCSFYVFMQLWGDYCDNNKV